MNINDGEEPPEDGIEDGSVAQPRIVLDVAEVEEGFAASKLAEVAQDRTVVGHLVVESQNPT